MRDDVAQRDRGVSLMDPRGLTLIEMLVVIAIVSILASAVMPLSRMTVMRVKETELRGALRTLRTAIDVFLRLFAPYLPFATEEVWSWTHDGSVHTAAWPTVAETGVTLAPRGLLPAVSEALIGIRRAKTDAKASQKTEVTSATIAGPGILRDALDGEEPPLPVYAARKDN